MRGPLATANPFTGGTVRMRHPVKGAALFAQCLRESVAKTMAHCPQAFVGVDIGFEDVPSGLSEWWSDQVPLATARSAAHGENATVVLFRRPIEHRAQGRTDLANLVNRTLVDQLAALTGISVTDLDPDVEDE